MTYLGNSKPTRMEATQYIEDMFCQAINHIMGVTKT